KGLYEALRQYVAQFGIENFSTNTSSIWQLARLSEKYGQPGEAVLLYKLVLKHHRQPSEVRQARVEYDSVTFNQRENYVPLEKYYELVSFRKEIDTLRPPQGVLVRMPDWVNSDKADYAPTIGNIDSLLLFTSKRNSTVQTLGRSYNEDLFIAVREYGQWLEAQPLTTINTSYNEGSACLS